MLKDLHRCWGLSTYANCWILPSWQSLSQKDRDQIVTGKFARLSNSRAWFLTYPPNEKYSTKQTNTTNINFVPTKTSTPQVSTYAISFVGGLYLTIGVCGSLAFGLKLDGNVLNNFPVTPLVVLFKCGFLLCIALSFPLVIFPSRISLNSLYLVSEKSLGVS